MRSLLRRPSPSMAVSLVALFVALGGTSYAAVALKANSVGTAQLRANAVTAAKVKNGSLRAVDFKAGDLPAGPAGPAGVVVRKTTGNLPVNGQGKFQANCAAGERVTGGGSYYRDVEPGPGDAMTESGPVVGDAQSVADGAAATGWYASYVNGGEATVVETYALCVAG